MEEKEVTAICKSGGVFHKAEDGSLSYSGGIAQAICIHNQMTFHQFQIEVGEMFGRSSIRTMSIKYLIPRYSKSTLITISNDKGIRNMIRIHGDSDFIELYIMTDEMLPLDVSNIQQCIRSSRTTLPEAMAPADTSLNNAVDDTNAAPELIAPVSGFGNTNHVESLIDIPIEVSPMMPRGDPNDTNTTPKLITPAIAPVCGFGDTNHVESLIDIPIEVSSMMPRGDPIQRTLELWKNPMVVGQTFNSVDDLRESIRKYAFAHQFALTFPKNKSDCVTVECKAEGCPWGIHALMSPKSAELFCIKEMTSEHTCDKAATTSGHEVNIFIAELIEEKLKVSPNYYNKIKDIVSHLQQEYGIQIKYLQAWRAKEIADGTYQPTRRAKKKADGTYQPARRAKKKAEKGQRKEHRRSPRLCEENITPELIAPVNGFGDTDYVESHIDRPIEISPIMPHGDCRSPLLGEMITEENPGSLATFTTKDDSTFPGRFFAFRASLFGFQHGCRPLLFLDSILLPSNFSLLTAFTIDGDNINLPIAFAVVDGETEKKWHHFLLQLKACLSISRPITFLAYSQYGLKELISNLFPGSFHAFCGKYLCVKLFEELKKPISSDVKKQIVRYWLDAWFASSPKGFHEGLERIKGISSEAYNWISEIEPTNWADAFFPGEKYICLVAYSSPFRSEIYKVCEEVSSVTQLVQALGVWTMKQIIKRRTASAQWMSRLTPSMEELLEEDELKAGCLEVLRSAGSTYEVCGGRSNEEVHIDKRNCSCGWWKIKGIPCCHALAVIHSIDGDPYEYCSRYRTTEYYRLTYSFV